MMQENSLSGICTSHGVMVYGDTHIGTFCGDGSSTLPLKHAIVVGKNAFLIMYTTHRYFSIQFTLLVKETETALYKQTVNTDESITWQTSTWQRNAFQALYFYTYKMQYKETFVFACWANCMTSMHNLINVEISGNAKVCSKQLKTNVKIHIYSHASANYIVSTNVCKGLSQYDVSAVNIHLGPDWPFLAISFTIIRNFKCPRQSLTADNNILHFAGNIAHCEIFQSRGNVPFILLTWTKSKNRIYDLVDFTEVSVVGQSHSDQLMTIKYTHTLVHDGEQESIEFLYEINELTFAYRRPYNKTMILSVYVNRFHNVTITNNNKRQIIEKQHNHELLSFDSQNWTRLYPFLSTMFSRTAKLFLTTNQRTSENEHIYGQLQSIRLRGRVAIIGPVPVSVNEAHSSCGSTGGTIQDTADYELHLYNSDFPLKYIYIINSV